MTTHTRVIGCLTILATVSLTAQQQAVFRSGADSVAINVSVKKGNNAVAGLSAMDFRLVDSGVSQTIAALSVESIPIDVTLFIDTSGSTAGRLNDMKKDVAGILQILRPDDKFRLLTIGDSVYETVPWVPAGTHVDLSFGPVLGRSLICDAIAAALTHRAGADRRHLIVAMTDREDSDSVVQSGLVAEMAKRADAVLHIVDQHGGSGSAEQHRIRVPGTMWTRATKDNLALAANDTGGALHDPFFGSASVLKTFTKVFDDFRSSYVLRYTPAGVPADGWHPVVVTAPALKSVSIRARSGYWAK